MILSFCGFRFLVTWISWISIISRTGVQRIGVACTVTVTA